MPHSVIQPQAPWPYPTHVMPTLPKTIKAPMKPTPPKLVASSSDPVVGTLPSPSIVVQPPKRKHVATTGGPRGPMVDLSTLVIERGQKLPRTARTQFKYDEAFKPLTTGDNVKCRPEDLRAVRQALGDWIVRQGMGRTHRAYGVTKCDDGHARVWLLPIKKNKTDQS